MKVQVTTIITEQVSFDRYEDKIKVGVFDSNEPISSIHAWLNVLDKQRIAGTGKSNVNIEFLEE